MKYVSQAFTVAALVALAFVISCSDDSPTAPQASPPPAADAGSPQQVNPNTPQVFLDGSRSTGDNLTYAWQQTSGVAVTLSDTSSAVLEFQAPSSEGTLVFRLSVTDRRGRGSTDDTIVLVVSSIQPPTANAGADQTVAINSTVTLHGSGSDPFGGLVTFSWRQYSGTTVTLSNPNIAKPSFTAPGAATTLEFELTVEDETNRTALDSVKVTVEAAPSPVPPILYVLNANSVSGWRNPHTVDGDKAPDLHILPDNAQFATPLDIVVDSKGALMVANRVGEITIFGAGNQNGMASPSRTVSGGSTGLSGPVALALGRSTDILLVSDSRQHGIISYDAVSRNDFDGDVPLSRAFWIPNYDMQPAPASYDESRDMLYVIDAFLNQILVFHQASALNGESGWSRTVTHISRSVALTNVFVDSVSDRLYVVSRGNKEIYVWDNASTVTAGDNVPTRTFSAGDAPVDIVVDSSNRGYVLDGNNAILSFDAVHTLTGTPMPTRTIVGEGTQLSSPIALYMYE